MDTEPHVGAIYVPNNSLLLTEQICGYLQFTKKSFDTLCNIPTNT